MPYSINGGFQDFAEPIERDGHVFIPLAGPIEVIGGYVTWDNIEKSASIELGDDRLTVQAENTDVIKNDETYALPVEPFIEHNTLFAPLELFQNVLNLQVVSNGSAVAIDQPSA